MRVIIVFEGRDAAGKGGTIKAILERTSPRTFRLVALPAPSDREKSQMYVQRYMPYFPAAGEIAIFDRSWYGRVLVERVEGFASEDEWTRAYGEIDEFETMLSSDGIRLAKFFLHISAREQLRRYRARASDPLKKYKLTRDDWRNRAKRKAYERAIQDMLDRTHRKDAPWHLVPAEDKPLARLTVLRACLTLLE
jgi:polyphosphate kinase 2 (PPK2 family)